jgi:hypothetical protein
MSKLLDTLSIVTLLVVVSEVLSSTLLLMLRDGEELPLEERTGWDLGELSLAYKFCFCIY